MFELYEHQKKVIESLRLTWKHLRTHVIYANVGFGKTAVAYHLIKSMNDRGLKVVFVAPYTTLVNQTYDRFCQYGLNEPSVIWRDDERYDEKNLCQIASADTLIRREFPADVDCLIIDECHIKREILLQIIEKAPFHVIGLSGTPFKKWMGEYYENLVKVTTMREMIDNGFLSDYEFYAPTKPDLSSVGTRPTDEGQEYIDEQVAEIMNGADIVGDIVLNWLKNGENRPTIAFCCNVLHANHVTNEFNRAGVKAEVMTAKTPKEERQQIVKRFEEGITKIICNVGVLVAGFDSDVRCIIYAKPTKSEIQWIQCLGRGLRTAEGKDKCIIFDHSGTVHRLGFPDSIEYDRLKGTDDGLDARDQKKKEIEKKEKEPKECSNCNFMKPAGVYVCPKCGHKPLAGEDVEVDESREINLITGKKQITKEEMQTFYSELLGLQTEYFNSGKAFADKRVNAVFKSKFDLWPNQAGVSKRMLAPSDTVKKFIQHENIKFAKSRKKKQEKKLSPEQAEKNAKECIDGLKALFEDFDS